MTSLPIYWSGGDAFAQLANAEGEIHWARAALEQRHTLDPIEILDVDTLSGSDVLILAQPRVLSPAENVALDSWIRGGGHALIFADPALVGESPYPLGDPRRPMDTVLLSPILSRWGLELTFDPESSGLKRVEDGMLTLDVVAAGAFVPSGSEAAQCVISAENVVADCAIGAGRAVLIADATLLEDSVGGSGAKDALFSLIDRTLGSSRETAGRMRD